MKIKKPSGSHNTEQEAMSLTHFLTALGVCCLFSYVLIATYISAFDKERNPFTLGVTKRNAD